MMAILRICLYLSAFVLGNFIVLWYGKPGLLITALLLIPFDFVLRCLFHEKWTGGELIFKLGGLVIVASCLTYWINADSQAIALGSALGFLAAQLTAGVFYQTFINKSYFLKVNGSDALAMIIDSIVFQWIAFGSLDPMITVAQCSLKMAGGLFWYWVIFVKWRLQEKW